MELMNIEVLLNMLQHFQALEVIKQASLSTAVFAPGWVYETQPKAIFFKNQDR